MKKKHFFLARHCGYIRAGKAVPFCPSGERIKTQLSFHLARLRSLSDNKGPYCLLSNQSKHMIQPILHVCLASRALIILSPAPGSGPLPLDAFLFELGASSSENQENKFYVQVSSTWFLTPFIYLLHTKVDNNVLISSRCHCQFLTMKVG